MSVTEHLDHLVTRYGATRLLATALVTAVALITPTGLGNSTNEAMAVAATAASGRPPFHGSVDRRVQPTIRPIDLPAVWADTITLDDAATVTGVIEHRHGGHHTIAVGFSTTTAPADLVNGYAWALGVDGFVETARFDAGSHGPPTALVRYERGTTTVSIALSWEPETTDAVITVGRALSTIADRVD